MKALVQRVERAAVRVDGLTIGEIGTGLLVLVGVTHSDTRDHSATLARKVRELRILRGERSVADSADASVLVVSQFTPVRRHPQGAPPVLERRRAGGGGRAARRGIHLGATPKQA